MLGLPKPYQQTQLLDSLGQVELLGRLSGKIYGIHDIFGFLYGDEEK